VLAVNKSFGPAWLVIVLILGVLMGAAGGALFVTWKVAGYETDAIAQSVAENAMGVIPALAALGEDDSELRLERFESAARTQITASIVTLHFGLRYASDEKRDYFEDVLRHIARIREKLKIGAYSAPPRQDIEDILRTYVE